MPDRYSIPVNADGVNAVDLLSDASGLSKQLIKQAMGKGAVWLERKGPAKRLRRAKKALHKGDQLYFYHDPTVLAVEIETPQLIADEGEYSVWYKPHGVLSQGSKWGDHCTLYRWSETHLQPQRPAMLVHRLDRAATGLMLLGHSKKATALLAGMFENRQLTKVYRVKVHGDLSTLNQPITIDRSLEQKSSVSHVRCLESDGQCSLLEVTIETGRKHQIRKHLSGLGAPVVGDRLYGKKDDEEDLQLTAYRLAFECPLSGASRSYCLDKSLLPTLYTHY